MILENLIKQEYEKLYGSMNESEKCNVIYNIIKLKVNISCSEGLYKDIKQFIDLYVETLKLADYGYDNYNYSKIDQLLNHLPSSQQISILQYMTSVSSRELPEHDRSWFITRKHKSEIKVIFENKNFVLYPKTAFLYFGQSITRLLFGLFILFVITCLILLPAPIESLEILDVKIENYSQFSKLNHIMNVLTLFADIDNSLKVKPIGLSGLLLIIFGKIIFVMLIMNFFYFKISDKISQK